MNAAITVENISKLYRIGVGQRAAYTTLREGMTTATKAVWNKMRGSKNAKAVESSDLWALRDVSFQVNHGEVLALVGRNGAGKSTMLKVLSRITAPTSGKIRLNGRVGSLLEVGTGFHPELTGRENVYLNGAILGMSRSEISRKFDEIVAFSEVERFLDTPVKRYSSGMYTRLAFSVASHLEPEILIVDEVLAVGDSAFQQKCLKRMKEVGRQGRTVLFVSHSMSAVKTLCTRAIVFDKGQLTYQGDVDEAVNRYLTGGGDTGRNGEIGPEFPRVCDIEGVARVRRVRITDVNGEPISQLFFGDRFRIGMTIEVMKEVDDAHLEISISTRDGIQVTYGAATDGGVDPVHLTTGMHEVWAEFDTHLLPREYSIDVGIHHHANGATLDFVQRAMDFSVLRVAREGQDHYHWPSTRGFVRGVGRWEVDGEAVNVDQLAEAVR